MLPSWRAMVVNAPVTPAPPLTVSPASSVNGGQEAAQSPLQLLAVFVSGVNMYSDLPSSPVRYWPSVASWATSTSYASAPPDAPAPSVAIDVAPGCVAAVVGAVVAPPALLQAASRSAAPARSVPRRAGRKVRSWCRFMGSSGPAITAPVEH